MWCNRVWLWVQESLLEEEHFLEHLLFLGRRASFNPRISVSEIIRWTERNGEEEKEESMRGTSRGRRELKFNLLLRHERVEIIHDG